VRNELKALEGDLVFVTGRPTEARRDGEDIYLMLVRPQLQRWDGMAPIGQGPAIQTDHLWVQCETNKWAGEMLQLVVGVGRVGYYRRADGTVDLGVALLVSIDLDLLLEDVHRMLGDSSRKGMEGSLAAMKKALETLRLAFSALWHQGGGGFAYSRYRSATESMKLLARHYRTLESSVLATEAALLSGKPKGHKPRGLDLPLRNCRKVRRLPGAA